MSEQSKPSNIWFYLKEGLFGDSEQGPFDLATMHQLMDLGEISLETKLRSPTRTNNAWTEAKYVQEIADKITTAQFAKEKRKADRKVGAVVVVGVAIFTCWLIYTYSGEAITALGLDSILPEDSTLSEIIQDAGAIIVIVPLAAWIVWFPIWIFCLVIEEKFIKDKAWFTKEENFDRISSNLLTLTEIFVLTGLSLVLLGLPIRLIEWWFE